MAELMYIGKQAKITAVPLHSHKDWEIICYTHGIGHLDFEHGEILDYKKGNIVIIPPNMRHANLSTNGFTNIYMHISGWSPYIKSPVMLADNNSSTVYHLLKQLLVLSMSSEKNLTSITHPFTDLILNLILEMIDTRPLSPYIEDIKNKLIENFSVSTFSIKDCLDSIPHNSEYLRQLFKKETGETPSQFLNNIRMDNAKKLLSLKHLSSLSIDEISSMCGFSDPLYFSRAFKKHTGQSPRSYSGNTLRKPSD